MFDDAVEAEIPEWNLRKLAQWERLARPDLQFVRSGPSNSTFRIAHHRAAAGDVVEFYEGVIFGRLPVIQLKKVGANTVVVPEARRSYNRRRIDLTDDQLAEVLAQWDNGYTAFELPFIGSVFHLQGERVK